MDVSIDITGEKAVQRLLNEFPDQVAFATSVALNKTAYDVMRTERKHMTEAFTLRNRGFPKHVVKVKKSSKKNQSAFIFANQKAEGYMTLQETGGFKVPRHGINLAMHGYRMTVKGGGVKKISGALLAIPTSNVRKTKGGKVRKRERPTNLKRSFLAQMSSGKQGIWQRTGKKRTPIRLMYSLDRHAVIPGQWGFIRTGTKRAEHVFMSYMNQSINKAIETAKKKV